MTTAMVPLQSRAMSTASIRDRFEQAYEERVQQLQKNPKKM